jgi:hypothetical protein
MKATTLMAVSTSFLFNPSSTEEHFSFQVYTDIINLNLPPSINILSPL